MFDRLLPIGPRSVLFGVHCFLIHPFLVAEAWRRLYGFPWDPRLWVCFFVHDLGYLFRWCREMDSEEGERHVLWGANLVGRLFGDRWAEFCALHSRFYAKQLGGKPSRLCVADKYSLVIAPDWLYLALAKASGELWEYMKLGRPHGKNGGKYSGERNFTDDPKVWLRNLKSFLLEWVEQYRGGFPDDWEATRR